MTAKNRVELIIYRGKRNDEKNVNKLLKTHFERLNLRWRQSHRSHPGSEAAALPWA